MTSDAAHTCSRCGNRFTLAPLPTFSKLVLGATPNHIPFGTYVYAVCPSCGHKDWAESRRFYGFMGPRTLYGVTFALVLGILLLVLYLAFFV